MNTCAMLRDGAYILSIFLCLICLLLHMNGHKTGQDDSLQKIFVSQHESHARHETLFIWFSCAITLGCSSLPNLILETIETKTTKDSDGVFLREKYFFALSYIAPNLVAFYGISSEYEHVGAFYHMFLSIFALTFTYITTRILEQSNNKVWTRNMIILNYSATYFFFAVIIQFSTTVLLIRIFGFLLVIVKAYIFFKYLLNVNVQKMMSGSNADESSCPVL